MITTRKKWYMTPNNWLQFTQTWTFTLHYIYYTLSAIHDLWRAQKVNPISSEREE